MEAMGLILLPVAKQGPEKGPNEGNQVVALMRVIRECPRVVSTCASVLVSKLCQPGFVQAAYFANNGAKFGEEMLQSFISVVVERVPLFGARLVAALMALLTPSGLVAHPDSQFNPLDSSVSLLGFPQYASLIACVRFARTRRHYSSQRSVIDATIWRQVSGAGSKRTRGAPNEAQAWSTRMAFQTCMSSRQ